MSIDRLKPADLSGYIGEVIGVSSWIVVDQQRINEFAHCTDDRQWIHVDVERAAKEGPFGATVAHCFLTLALLAPTIFEVMLSRVEVKQAINYGLERVRFLAPVRSGSVKVKEAVKRCRLAGFQIQREFKGTEGFPNAYIIGPDEVKIEGAVSADTKVSWTLSPGAAGYQVWRRDTTDPRWRFNRWAGTAASLTLNGVVIDDWFFGVSAVSADGWESPVEYPGPAGAFFSPPTAKAP